MGDFFFPFCSFPFFSFLFLSFNLSLLSGSALLCFSSVHIVGSLTAKLPSIIYRRYTQRHQYISVLWSFQQMLSLKTSKTVSIKSRDKCASLHHMCREPYVGTAGIKIEKDTHHLPGSNTTQSMLDAMQLLPGKWGQLVSSSAMDNIPSSANTSHAKHSMLIHMSFGVICIWFVVSLELQKGMPRVLRWIEPTHERDQGRAPPTFALCNFLGFSWHSEGEKKKPSLFTYLLILLIMSSDTELILAWSRPNLWVAPAENVLTKKAPSEPCLYIQRNCGAVRKLPTLYQFAPICVHPFIIFYTLPFFEHDIGRGLLWIKCPSLSKPTESWPEFRRVSNSSVVACEASNCADLCRSVAGLYSHCAWTLKSWSSTDICCKTPMIHAKYKLETLLISPL